MITSLYANKVFIKIQRYFMIIIFSIPGRKGSFLNLKKVSTPKSTVYFIYAYSKSTAKACVVSGVLQASFRPVLCHWTFSYLSSLWFRHKKKKKLMKLTENEGNVFFIFDTM